MSEFRGHLAYITEALTAQDRARMGSPFLGTGLATPRVWRDDVATLCHAQRIVTAEDRAERQPMGEPAGRVVLSTGICSILAH